MTEEALYSAINEIDEELILEADTLVFVPKAFAYFKKILCAAALLALVTCSAIYLRSTEKPLIYPSTKPLTSAPEVTASTHTTAFSKSPDTDGLDSHLSPDFSGYTLSMWLTSPDVIWNNGQLKGEAVSSISTPLGTVKITDSLKALIESNGDLPVYAVLVDFSSCVDENEAEEWEYGGVSVKKLRDSFESGNKSKAEITEYKSKIREIKTAYNNMRIKGFEDTFGEYGLKIYTAHNDSFVFSHCFYVFATSGQIQNLQCKADEAFVLSSADRSEIK